MTCPAGPSRGATGGQFWTSNSPVIRSEKLHELGAPLRNRTVDLLLTMNNRQVPSPQVERLTSQNMSTDQRPRAPGRISRAPVATQSATQFDLVLRAAGVAVLRSADVGRAEDCAPAWCSSAAGLRSCTTPRLASVSHVADPAPGFWAPKQSHELGPGPAMRTAGRAPVCRCGARRPTLCQTCGPSLRRPLSTVGAEAIDQGRWGVLDSAPCSQGGVH